MQNGILSSRTLLRSNVAQCVLLLFFYTGPLLAAPSDTRLDVTFAARTVTAKGLTPHADAVFFAIGRIPLPAAHMMSIVRWRQVVTDDDGDGSVTLSVNRDIPPESIWIVANLTNGDYTVVRPSGPGLERAPSSNPLRKHGTRVDTFSFEGQSVDLLYIHAGKGAWWWMARDGSPGDADGLNGRAAVSISDAAPLAVHSARPADFAPGGTLLAIDYQTLDVVSLHLDGSTMAGAQ